MGDFTSFSFGDWHSSNPETGIVTVYRVSGGDRYDEELHPEIKDRTAEVPGLDGEYYFGSDYGTKSIDIEIAFDSLTEEQFRRLRRVFGTRDIKKLVFDERPYKYYMAKLESPVELSYVCFDEPIKVDTTIEGIRYKTENGYSNIHTVKRSNGGKQRIYKGEGKLSFICYFPFAKSNFKVLPSAGSEYYEGSEEWAISSGLFSESQYSAGSYDTYVKGTGEGYNEYYGSILTYNPGDIPTGFRLLCVGDVFNESHGDPDAHQEIGIRIYYKQNGSSMLGVLNDYDDVLKIKKFDLKPGDIGFMIDSHNQIIYGISDIGWDSSGNRIYTYTTHVYNEYIYDGAFFKLSTHIPYSESGKMYIYGVNNEAIVNSQPPQPQENNQEDSQEGSHEGNQQETVVENVVELYYDYLYF